jgi:hypothetical protein
MADAGTSKRCARTCVSLDNNDDASIHYNVITHTKLKEKIELLLMLYVLTCRSYSSRDTIESRGF